MAGAKKTDPLQGFTAAELARIETGQPDLWARMQAGELFAEDAARAWLNQTRHRRGDAPGKDEAAPPAPAPVAVQLPLWPEPVRAVPNGVLRSALFGAIRKGRRPMLDQVKLAALGGIELWYTGPRLDQGDLDAWGAILHTIRGQDMGRECRTTSAALLRLMGFADSGKHRKLLEEKIARLNAGAIKIRGGRYLYMGSLLDWAAKDEETQEWVIVLNPKLAELFAPDQYTRLQWGTRRALAGQPLAQWLHGFYSSHAEPYPLRIETLQRLCGSEAGELKHFTQALKKALEAVERASAAAGEGFAWKIEGGLVYVERTPSAAQRRHLDKRGQDSDPPY